MHSINRSQTGLFRICCFSLVRESMMMYPNDSNFIGAKFKLEHYANDKIHGFAVTSVFANFFPGVTRRSAGLETLPGQKNRTLLQLEMPQKSVGGLESSSVRQFSSILTREKHGKTEQTHGFLEVTHFWRTQHAWHVHALWRCDVIHQLLKGRRDNIQFVRCTTSSIGDLGEFGFGQLISFVQCFSMFFWGSETETSY